MQRTAVLLTLFVAGAVLVPAARPIFQGAQAPRPQQPALTFRALSNYTEVDAIVTDANGDAVRDLTCTDFEVSEDGKPQTLSVCGFVDIPVERPDPLLFKTKAIEPDVATNEKPFDGRIFMIVLDRYHVGSLRGPAVKKEAAHFIDRYMGENDIAAVVQVGDSTGGQEFTSNKRLLKEAIAKFNPQPLTSASASINKDALARDQLQITPRQADIAPPDPGPAADPDALVREFHAKESMGTVRRLAEYMGSLTGRRKSVLLFSEGIGIDLLKMDQPVGNIAGQFTPPQTDSQSVRAAEDGMITAAGRSNVSIYSIDPRGLTGGQEDASEMGVSPASSAGTGLARDYANSNLHVDAADESRRQQESLRTFSDATGGLAIINQNDMDEAFSKIVRDNSAYYMLGYSSPDPRHDGKFHRVSVKVKRPGLKVRTRNGYYSPADDPGRAGGAAPDPVGTMLRAPAPVGGLGMHVNASVIKGLAVKSTVHLTIEFSGRSVALKSSGGLFVNDIDVEYIALDTKGAKQANGREVAHLQLRPDTKDAFAERGVRYVTEFDLPAGRYQLRVAARDHLVGRTGSVFYDLEVPDVVTPRLAMSDLLITTSAATKTPTPNNTSTIGGILPAPTTTVREFGANDTITVAASIYDNDDRAPHQVDYLATITSDLGAQGFKREEHRDSVGMSSAKGGFMWTVAVPLKGLAPGRYVLAVGARSRLSGVEPVTKESEFRIK